MNINIEPPTTEIGTFLKDSLIEVEIISYLDNNDVPANLKKDLKFISLVCDKLYCNNKIYNLRARIQEHYFDGAPPNEINEFYSQYIKDRQAALDHHNNRINKLKTEYDIAISENKNIELKINSMLVNSNNFVLQYLSYSKIKIIKKRLKTVPRIRIWRT